MARRPGQPKGEAQVIQQVLRPRLRELGFEETDWVPEAKVEFFPGRTGDIDLLVRIGNHPLIVAETKAHAAGFSDGFKQGRAYAIFLDDPARPVPYMMVAAGRKLGLFRAEPAAHGGAGIVYVPTERLLTRDEILDAVGEMDEELPTEVIALETLITVFGKVFQEIQGSKRPHIDDEGAVMALADVLVAKVRGEDPAPVYQRHRLARHIQARIEELLGNYHLPRYQGRPLGYALRHFVGRTFTGGPYRRYLTPAEVIHFMVRLAAPQPDGLIVDPVCGSGGFLGRIALGWLAQGVRAEEIIAHLVGCDVDPLAVEVAQSFLELLLPGEQRDLKVHRKNSLSMEQEFAWEEDLVGLLEPGTFDLVIGNPPAGNPFEKDSLPEEYRDLQTFFKNLPGSYPFTKKQRRHEIAHLERFLALAKPGGTVAIILPDGIFANAQMSPIRQYLANKTKIEVVVGLPRGIFPFTPSKMCAVLLHKEEPPRGHQVLLAEVSDRRALSAQLDMIAQAYEERTR
jgi:SAM-dependent methyltransferase